jgi:quinolinate synthase
MYRISPEALAKALEALAAGEPINIVKVDEDTARWATVALERMLEARV